MERMGKLSRTKGLAFEREIARRFSIAGRTKVERELHEVRDGNLGDLRSDLPLSIQCKVGTNPSVWKAVDEAEYAAKGEGLYAIAVVRRNRSQGRKKQDLVCMSLRDFEDILSELRARGVW